jgi:SAM-dependent methyltransferase
MIKAMVFLIGLGSGQVATATPDQSANRPPESGVALLQTEAAALKLLVSSRLARDFLDSTPRLPAIAPRALYADKTKQNYFTETQVQSLADEERRALERVPVDETFYYTTKYGSPLAYSRPLDLLGKAGLESVAGRKILDFGYGTIGHLRLLAELGADVTGVDVDPLLSALYRAADGTSVATNRNGSQGRIRLIHGRFPSDRAIGQAVGGGYDLIISKNTLKRGYVHPERAVEKRRLLNLGVDDRVFLESIHIALKPGGRILIYNISPAPTPPGRPYKHWADGRCPFPRESWESAGFRVIAFDQDDSTAIRLFAHALGWDRGDAPMDLKSDVFALYSLFEKPDRTSTP